MTLKLLKIKQEQEAKIELINLRNKDELKNLESNDINKTKKSLKHSKGLFII